jgi:hypothetical protein
MVRQASPKTKEENQVVIIKVEPHVVVTLVGEAEKGESEREASQVYIF